MKTYQVQIRVRFKDGILDPQAEAIFSALQQLDFRGVETVSCEKAFLVQVRAENEGQAKEQGRLMAQKLLANLVMENFEVEVL